MPNIPVGYAEIWPIWLNHPNLIDVVDFILTHHHPYWEGIAVEKAVAAVANQYPQVVAVAKGKPVIIGETGWPSAGDKQGDAIPSLENACSYFFNFVSWARANNVLYAYFEAFDEPWKAKDEGPQGAHWGVWDKDGILKSCMQPVFDNETILGGPGEPTIEFTYVPPIGSFENLQGQVWHVNPSDYKVAVYIFVGKGWWTKPTWASPLTSIQVDGSWVTDITTGGIDQTATKIAACLVPNGYNPPQRSGQPDLPAELYQNAAACVQTNR